MAKNDWRDINDPGRFYRPVEEDENQTITDEAPEEKKAEAEVRLKNPRIEAGSAGYQYNKPCTLTVDVEYLKETPRKRVLFDLFAVYNGAEE